MTDPGTISASAHASPPGRVLRRLFLTLFLRGRSARGLKKERAPASVGSKLALTLVFYAAFGLLALVFLHQPVFALAAYLHAMTFVFLGMFVAASAGEVLFNKEEADILLHRPVTAQSLLWSKISVLVQVSLWLAGAFNLCGLIVGLFAGKGGWLFPVAHVISTIMQALFCTGTVVVTYQLCLRWFGRERLDGIMTTAQVVIAVAAVLAGQAVPQLIVRFGDKLQLQLNSWWIALLPPAWFAGFDDLIAGGRSTGSLMLAVTGLAATAAVLWLAFSKLARDYQSGLQTLNEASSLRTTRKVRRRWVDSLVTIPPLRWWLRDPVSRASFLLAAAYLFRDRDVKLRIYPGIAPMLAMPAMMLIQERWAGSGGFGVAVAGVYFGLVPLMGVNLLQYSQQWQAADLFRTAPLSGPARLIHGARGAVVCFLAVPGVILFGLLAWLVHGDTSHLGLLLPGIIAIPVYALVPNLHGAAIPLSMPVEEAKSAGRGLYMVATMMCSFPGAGIAVWAWHGGWFKWFLLGESILVAGLYAALRASISRSRWPSTD